MCGIRSMSTPFPYLDFRCFSLWPVLILWRDHDFRAFIDDFLACVGHKGLERVQLLSHEALFVEKGRDHRPGMLLSDLVGVAIWQRERETDRDRVRARTKKESNKNYKTEIESSSSSFVLSSRPFPCKYIYTSMNGNSKVITIAPPVVRLIALFIPSMSAAYWLSNMMARR